jgi:hypothetical protein
VLAIYFQDELGWLRFTNSVHSISRQIWVW